mmetsp:Transcript_4470/g.16767  ORF Transcript_4470/g.16767 Transcript_4470/m.16767 type:complete len:309 (-) Transcript_4470:150-1076(-)
MLAASPLRTSSISARTRPRRTRPTKRRAPPLAARRDSDGGRVRSLNDLASLDDDDDAERPGAYAFVNRDGSYNNSIDNLLDEQESAPWVTRAMHWLTALTACGWPPLKGGANASLVEIRRSDLGGCGVFARRAIERHVTVGEYPGVRRSLRDYLDKCERTEGRTQVYGVMCRDLWVLDPTGPEGILRVDSNVLTARSVAFDDSDEDSDEDSDDDSYSYSHSYGTYREGTATPTVSLFGGFGLRCLTRDATIALCNEPRGLHAGEREAGANVGVRELRTGTQVVYTLRDVAEGEELLWDYGESYNREHY